ncbi:uncharacterized protein LOC136026283 [Artemia franciscana]|uniref:Uncharacterized protein n=1 Tax=Artemia franciscana TaxID=6661 RepID=A0AA88HKY8_ARTSF|nr:hypothetical protein QYM36_012500 [Artemia franciscana]KAK2711336.1 hypothetical protein QYM36_012500 [Artemia franciscana]
MEPIRIEFNSEKGGYADEVDPSFTLPESKEDVETPRKDPLREKDMPQEPTTDPIVNIPYNDTEIKEERELVGTPLQEAGREFTRETGGYEDELDEDMMNSDESEMIESNYGAKRQKSVANKALVTNTPRRNE